MTSTSLDYSEACRLLESAFSAEIVVRRAQAQQVRALAAFMDLGGSRRSVTEEVALYFSVTRTKAGEAATAVVYWATSTGTHPVIARIRPDNVASQRVAVRAGLVRAEHLDDEGFDGPDQIFIAK